MARITVEDCLDHVDNRFSLVLLATKRARQLVNGAEPFVPWENDKSTVVALREIAEGFIRPDTLAKMEQQATASELAAEGESNEPEEDARETPRPEA